MATKNKDRKQDKAVEEVAEEVVDKAPPKKRGTVKVVAVIRPMYSPNDKVLIPEESGVFIKKGSWADSQIERGLLKVVR